MATMGTSRIDRPHTVKPTLHWAFELGFEKWKLGFTAGVAPRARERSIAPGKVPAVLEEVARAKQRFGLPEDARVMSCHEAGRDGFWLHRCLVAHGIENPSVGSSSIAVNRRQRRAKTDRLDVHKLLTMLLRYLAGAQRCGGRSPATAPGAADGKARPDAGDESHPGSAGGPWCAHDSPGTCQGSWVNRSGAGAGSPLCRRVR
jgi:hypothetical protein